MPKDLCFFEVKLLVGVPKSLLIGDYDSDTKFVEGMQYQKGLLNGCVVEWGSAHKLAPGEEKGKTKSKVKVNPWATGKQHSRGRGGKAY